jgi:hypothetical protein
MESQSGRGVGNSMQDLYLSLYGYKLGRSIRKGDMTARDAAALRIRTDLGAGFSDQIQPSGDGATA